MKREPTWAEVMIIGLLFNLLSYHVHSKALNIVEALIGGAFCITALLMAVKDK